MFTSVKKKKVNYVFAFLGIFYIPSYLKNWAVSNLRERKREIKQNTFLATTRERDRQTETDNRQTNLIKLFNTQFTNNAILIPLCYATFMKVRILKLD